MTPLELNFSDDFTDDEKISMVLSNYNEIFSVENVMRDGIIMIVASEIMEIIKEVEKDA